MSVNSILGLPTIIQADIEPKWKQKIYLLHNFHAQFPIEFLVTKRAQVSAEQINISVDRKISVKWEATLMDTSKTFVSVFTDSSDPHVENKHTGPQ